MTAAELITRLDALGVTIHLVDGKPKLRFPAGSNNAAILQELGDDLATHRAATLDHYAPQEQPDHPGRMCGMCGATMYHELLEDQYRLCGAGFGDGVRAGSIHCPAWRPNLASAQQWVGAARESAEYQRRKLAAKKTEQDAPIPD